MEVVNMLFQHGARVDLQNKVYINVSIIFW